MFRSQPGRPLHHRIIWPFVFDLSKITRRHEDIYSEKVRRICVFVIYKPHKVPALYNRRTQKLSACECTLGTRAAGSFFDSPAVKRLECEARRHRQWRRRWCEKPWQLLHHHHHRLYSRLVRARQQHWTCCVVLSEQQPACLVRVEEYMLCCWRPDTTLSLPGREGETKEYRHGVCCCQSPLDWEICAYTIVYSR